MDEEQSEVMKKLAEALGGMSEAMSEATAKIEENKAAQQIYTKQIKETNDAEAKVMLAKLKENAALLRGEKAYIQQMEALGLSRNALGEFERATVSLTKEQKRRLAEEQEITNRQRARDEVSAKYNSMLANKTGTLIEGLTAFGHGLNKTLLDSTKGQGKYGDVMSSFGDGIMNITKNLGPLGQAAGFAAGALFKLVGAAFKQQEQLNKAYEKLSDFGAVDVTGIQGLFKNLQNMGMTVAELEKFGNILKSVAPNLSTLGLTTAEGAKKLADVMATIKNTGVERELRMLGYTSESMAKTFADYMTLMGRQGLVQGKSAAQVAKESEKYAKTLDELAKLTGQTRDEMQKRMEADANDIRFRLKIQELEKNGQKDLADKLRQTSAMMAGFGKDVHEGFVEAVVNDGEIVGEASSRLMIGTGDAFDELNKGLLFGKTSAFEYAKGFAEAQAKMAEGNGIFNKTAKLSVELAREVGLTAESLNEGYKYRGKSEKEYRDILDQQKQQAKGNLDRERATEVLRQMTERNFEQGKDRLTNLVGKVLVGAFEKLLRVVHHMGLGLAKFVKGLTGLDLTDLFESADDVQENLRKTAQQLDDTNKKIQDVNNARDIYLQKEKESIAKSEQINKLEQDLKKETNEEKRKQLIQEIAQAQKERVALDAETKQARSDFKKQNALLEKLQEDKFRLEKQEQDQRSKLGKMGVIPESAEFKKLKEEAEKLGEERKALDIIIEDKSKEIFKNTLEQLKISEEDLKNQEKKQEFEKAYAENKKKYIDRSKEIDQKLIKIDEQVEQIKSREANELVRSKSTSAMPVISQEAKGNLQSVATAMRKRGVTDEAYIKAALGNVMKESGGSLKGENLDYSKTSNERIRQVFGDRARKFTNTELDELKQDQQKFTEAMYGGEWGKKQLGNTEAGDAWKFRGRGYIQLTGRSNYAKASKDIFGDDRLIENPDLVNDPNVAAELTAWYFGKNKESMQASMGFGKGPLTQEQANLLATSQVAGGDVRKKSQYIQTELLGKVAGYTGQIDTTTVGPTASTSGPQPIGPTASTSGPQPTRPTASASGSQIPKVATGGILSGPDSGYPVLLHGKELVIPMPNTSDLAGILESVKKTALADDTNVQKTTTTTINSQTGMDQFIALQTDLMNLIANKLDMLDSRLAKSNDIQENILTYSAT